MTTNIVVRTDFLEQHPDVVKAFLEGHVDALEPSRRTRQAAQDAVNTSLTALTGSAIDPADPDQAWKQVEFTADPLAETLKEIGGTRRRRRPARPEPARAAGDINGLYDLTLLNAVLKKTGCRRSRHEPATR